jgi:hypothetical protein
MINFENSTTLLESLNIITGQHLVNECSEFSSKLVTFTRQGLFQPQWFEGKSLISFKNEGSKDELLIIAKYKSGDLIWFEYYFPKVKNEKSKITQTGLINGFEELKFQDNAYQVTQNPSFNKKEFNTAFLSDEIGIELWTFNTINLISYCSTFVLTLVKAKTEADYFSVFLIGITLIWSIWFAFCVYDFYLYPNSDDDYKDLKISGLGPLVFKPFLVLLEYKVNKQLVDQSINSFCSLRVYKKNGSFIDESKVCFYEFPYYLVDQESGQKIARLTILQYQTTNRIVITPLLSSYKTYEHISMLYIELLELDKFQTDNYLVQVSKSNIAKSNPNWFERKFFKDDLGVFVKFQLTLFFTLTLSTIGVLVNNDFAAVLLVLILVSFGFMFLKSFVDSRK